MAGFSVPDEIRALRPSADTTVKRIGDNYYVYEYRAKKLGSGKWGTKTGRCVGKIVPGEGFSPNANYGATGTEAMTNMEYGQYGLVECVAHGVLEALERSFPLKQAAQIFAFAGTLYVNGFVHMDQVGPLYEQSWLSLAYGKYSFRMGASAIATLLDGLGRKRNGVEAYEQSSIDASSGDIAMDGHVVRSCSKDNDLAEAGYKEGELKADQVNILVAYDVATEYPLCTRVFRGSSVDKSSVQAFVSDHTFKGVLFIADRGFFSSANLELLSRGGNSYIIPEPSNTADFKREMADLHLGSDFYYSRGKTVAWVQYRQSDLSDGGRIIIYRDMAENQKTAFNYRRCMEMGKKGYGEDDFQANRDLWGVYVLRTTSSLSAQETYEKYKSRWRIENYFDYIRNGACFRDLKIEDYYQEQGFAFIMLVTGQIRSKMEAAVRGLHVSTLSPYDVVIAARRMKMSLHGKQWRIDNKRTKDLEMFGKLGFVPDIMQEKW